MTGDAFAYPPRLLSKDEAARYISVSPKQLDRLVEDGIMPGPKRLGVGRIVWDRVALDIAAGDLPDRDGGGLQALLEKSRKTGTAKTEAERTAERTAEAIANRRPGQRKYWRDE